MLLCTLGASLLGNVLAAKGAIATRQGKVQLEQEKAQLEQAKIQLELARIFNNSSSFKKFGNTKVPSKRT